MNHGHRIGTSLSEISIHIQQQKQLGNTDDMMTSNIIKLYVDIKKTHWEAALNENRAQSARKAIMERCAGSRWSWWSLSGLGSIWKLAGV